MGYILLFFAILVEVIATTALKYSQEFTKIGPSIVVIIGYGSAIFLLSLVIKTVPVGIAYAIWAGMGIFLITIVSSILFKQTPDFPAILGLILIILGVIIIQLFSKTSGH